MYGHNGSGKSTFAELLLSLAEDDSAVEVIWEDENQKRTAVSPGGSSPSPSMAVFTRKWVEANLSAFLDGASASAIVTLGEAAIHAKEEEQRLASKIEDLSSEVRQVDEEFKDANQKVEKLAREVQDRITSELNLGLSRR